MTERGTPIFSTPWSDRVIDPVLGETLPMSSQSTIWPRPQRVRPQPERLRSWDPRRGEPTPNCPKCTSCGVLAEGNVRMPIEQRTDKPSTLASRARPPSIVSAYDPA